MALDAGTVSADRGMSKAIYDVLDSQFAPPLLEMIREETDPEARKVLEKALADARKGWKQLAFSVASGVVAHITSSMEVFGIQSATADGSVVVNQRGATTGHVR